MIVEAVRGEGRIGLLERLASSKERMRDMESFGVRWPVACCWWAMARKGDVEPE